MLDIWKISKLDPWPMIFNILEVHYQLSRSQKNNIKGSLLGVQIWIYYFLIFSNVYS